MTGMTTESYRCNNICFVIFIASTCILFRDTLRIKMNVCRTCFLEIMDNNFIHLNNDPSVKIELSLCVPEVTLDLVRDPVLCASCVSALRSAYTFKQRCLKTQQCIWNAIRSLNLEKSDLVITAIYRKVNGLRLQTNRAELAEEPLDNHDDVKMESPRPINVKMLDELNDLLDKALSSIENRSVIGDGKNAAEGEEIVGVEKEGESLGIKAEVLNQEKSTDLGNTLTQVDDVAESSTECMKHALAPSCRITGKRMDVVSFEDCCSSGGNASTVANTENPTPRAVFHKNDDVVRECSVKLSRLPDDVYLIPKIQTQSITQEKNKTRNCFVNLKELPDVSAYLKLNSASLGVPRENKIAARRCSVNVVKLPDVLVYSRLNSAAVGVLLDNNEATEECCVNMGKLSDNVVYSKQNSVAHNTRTKLSSTTRECLVKLQRLPCNYLKESDSCNEESRKCSTCDCSSNGSGGVKRHLRPRSEKRSSSYKLCKLETGQSSLAELQHKVTCNFEKLVVGSATDHETSCMRKRSLKHRYYIFTMEK